MKNNVNSPELKKKHLRSQQSHHPWEDMPNYAAKMYQKWKTRLRKKTNKPRGQATIDVNADMAPPCNKMLTSSLLSKPKSMQ
jgi:hypothetical protein